MLNITGHKKIFFIISGLLMLASIVSLLIQGFNLDTDFAGGSAVTFKLGKDFTTADVESIASDVLGDKQKPSSVQKSDGNEVIIKFAFPGTLKDDNARNKFSDESIANMTTKLAEKYGTAEVIGRDKVLPSTGIELAKSALWMSILAALAILVYVTFRFEFTSGACAVLALVHDVLILCGIYSILQIAIDTNFIAAVLTVLGYSINATIIIFDRIRENTRHAKKQSYSEIANTSINQTIRRSINTTITTLLTIGMVYIMGVTSIKVFALPIIIGIVIGTYSSICIAGTVWSTWKDTAVNSKAAKNAK
ncbi:MAG: protein translocase subunit SecF [Clostridia bacterium]|nr:protein translocase subunit SecF [Clostridia bacterium]